MDIQRICSEVVQATKKFAYVEAHPTGNGGVFVKAVMQTTAGNTYFAAIHFANYPSQMPKVFITKPDLQGGVPHKYIDGNLCYLHPNMWNPGRHDLTFVLGHTAKWLNKYEVWRQNGGRWPGASLRH